MCEPSRKLLTGPLTCAPFRVDDFTKGVTVYFLSHAHADHLTGLNENWRCGRLYCTSITKRILMLKFPSFDEKLIRTLEIGDRKLIPISRKVSISVTVLDARHCAGSCMFLFESRNIGRVLHTGDFRYEIGTQLPEMLREVEEGVSTCVYLDNTYGLETSPTFPSRKEVRDALLGAVAKYPSSTRFVFAMHGFGKEELVVEVARYCRSRVLVENGDRLGCIRNYGEHDWLELFTDCVDHLDMNEMFRVMIVSRLEDLTLDEANDVIITCSGWCGMEGLDVLRSIARGEHSALPRQLRVPYSLHSSKEEMIHFLKQIDVQYVIPIVHVSKKERDQLGLESLKEWTMVGVQWDDDLHDSPFSGEKPMRSHQRIVASPASHHRRLQVKRMRLMRDRQFDEIEIVVRREGDHWSQEEDMLLADLIKAKREMDLEGHEEIRRRLIRRSDNEIMMRLMMFRDRALFNSTLN